MLSISSVVIGDHLIRFFSLCLSCCRCSHAHSSGMEIPRCRSNGTMCGIRHTHTQNEIERETSSLVYWLHGTFCFVLYVVEMLCVRALLIIGCRAIPLDQEGQMVCRVSRTVFVSVSYFIFSVRCSCLIIFNVCTNLTLLGGMATGGMPWSSISANVLSMANRDCFT